MVSSNLQIVTKQLAYVMITCPKCIFSNPIGCHSHAIPKFSAKTWIVSCESKSMVTALSKSSLAQSGCQACTGIIVSSISTLALSIDRPRAALTTVLCCAACCTACGTLGQDATHQLMLTAHSNAVRCHGDQGRASLEVAVRPLQATSGQGLARAQPRLNRHFFTIISQGNNQ